MTGAPEADLDRTTADGKASSVQFVHFPFTDEQVSKFKSADIEVTFGFGHPEYGHMSVLPENIRVELSNDFY